MARVQASDVNWRRLCDHIPLHVDRERTIVDALHIDARNSAEPLRRQVYLRHERCESLRSQPCACVGDVCIGAIVIKNLPHLIGHDSSHRLLQQVFSSISSNALQAISDRTKIRGTANRDQLFRCRFLQGVLNGFESCELNGPGLAIHLLDFPDIESCTISRVRGSIEVGPRGDRSSEITYDDKPSMHVVIPSERMQFTF
jgi:hypothetical protein